jgi:catechol 2,3-dioxygenase-like lactoylglutathione lyase family enzyme
MKLEVLVIPVSDVDRAKEFYSRLGWRLDADVATGEDFRLIQLTPPGSGCSGEWVDAEPIRHVVRAFRTLAENIVESLAKGDRVFVHGTVTTDAWTDEQSGEKRTAQRVLADIVGPSLRWATARITKAFRSSATDEIPHDVSGQEG